MEEKNTLFRSMSGPLTSGKVRDGALEQDHDFKYFY